MENEVFVAKRYGEEAPRSGVPWEEPGIRKLCAMLYKEVAEQAAPQGQKPARITSDLHKRPCSPSVTLQIHRRLPAASPAIHFRLPFYDLTTQFFLEFYGISLKPPEGDTAPFSRSEINSRFIASGNAGAAVGAFDGSSQLQRSWSILYLHLHRSPTQDMRVLLPSLVSCTSFSV